jgi:hypothetical protein
MVRGALWLLTEVGEGNTFTKENLRTVFPGISQADRRIRDLRQYGWVILASTEDASLSSDEQRFVRRGIDVWLPKARQKVDNIAVSAKQRREVMAADGYQCTLCGIAGGETYADSMLASAVLSLTRRPVKLPDGSSQVQLVTECNRCRAGEANQDVTDLRRLLTDVEQLDASDLARLRRWIDRGRRGPTPLDRIWTSYRQMPSETRRNFQASVDAKIR